MSRAVNPVPVLPHAHPFVLLDRVVSIEERTGVFLKHVAAADPCTAADGTLPAAYVMEALAQAGGAFLAARDGSSATPGYLAGIDDFRLHRDVRVGETLRVEVQFVRRVANADLFRGKAFVEETVVAEGRFTLAQPR